MIAVQLAVVRGARVIGTASPANHQYHRSLGAEPVAYAPCRCGERTRPAALYSDDVTLAPFVHPLRVRYAECDPQQVVFNANYFAYFDVAMTELWRAAIGRYAAMLDGGVDMVVAEASARFLGAAHFDDELELEVSIMRLGRTACTTRHRVLRGEEVLVEGEMRHVFVDPTSFEKLTIPDWLREALAPWAIKE
jgi:acyl-CoA thioester hydrolase